MSRALRRSTGSGRWLLPSRSPTLIDSHIYGFVLQEINLPFVDGDDLGGVLDSMMPAHFAVTHPYFAELTREFVLRKGYSYSDEFEFGLDLVLGGLAVHAVA